MEHDPADDLRSVPAAEARALLDQQQQSGLSVAAFARLKGVQPWSLYNARAAERRKSPRERASSFAEVSVVDHQPAANGGGSAIELVIPSGFVLRVRHDFDEVALRRILRFALLCPIR